MSDARKDEVVAIKLWRLEKQVKDLQKENQELRIQASSREEVANEYKEAIDKIKRICDKVPYDWSVCGIEVVHKIEKVLEGVE